MDREKTIKEIAEDFWKLRGILYEELHRIEKKIKKLESGDDEKNRYL